MSAFFVGRLFSLGIFHLLWMVLPLSAQPEPRMRMIFYSSESNITNFNTLKRAFDTYFFEKSDIEFQPFSDRATFEQFLTDKKVHIVMLSSWHFHQLSQSNELVPVLVGQLGNQISQKRILVGTNRTKSSKRLSVATAVSEDFARNLLKRMNPPFQLDRLEFLVVPKDIDALMAVGFGNADMALTTGTSLQKLESINPKLAHSLMLQSTSEDILLPIIAARNASSSQVQRILKSLEAMGNTPEGKTTLKILGLDGWKRLTGTERGTLEP